KSREREVAKFRCDPLIYNVFVVFPRARREVAELVRLLELDQHIEQDAWRWRRHARQCPVVRGNELRITGLAVKPRPTLPGIVISGGGAVPQRLGDAVDAFEANAHAPASNPRSG